MVDQKNRNEYNHLSILYWSEGNYNETNNSSSQSRETTSGWSGDLLMCYEHCEYQRWLRHWSQPWLHYHAETLHPCLGTHRHCQVWTCYAWMNRPFHAWMHRRYYYLSWLAQMPPTWSRETQISLLWYEKSNCGSGRASPTVEVHARGRETLFKIKTQAPIVVRTTAKPLGIELWRDLDIVAT